MTRVWFRRLTSWFRPVRLPRPLQPTLLVKKGNGEKDLEVQIPGLAKFAEIVSKYAFITETASVRFKKEKGDSLRLVDLKIEELYLAVVAATSIKFQTKFESPLLKCFEALAVGNVDAETSTLLFQTLEDVRSFTVLSKAAMAKVMGEERQGKCDAFVNDTKTFFSNLKKASTDLVSMFSTTSTLGVSSLLSEELVSFMEGLANDEILANVRKMLPKLSPLISRVQRQVQECAKKILGQNASELCWLLDRASKE